MELEAVFEKRQIARPSLNPRMRPPAVISSQTRSFFVRYVSGLRWWIDTAESSRLECQRLHRLSIGKT